MGVHDWVTFKQGRARFAGGIRGWDEVGHETFAVELGDRVLYGEIKTSFLPDGNNFNIEIVSFGYFSQGDVAMPRPGRTSTRLSPDDLVLARSLISELVSHVSQEDDSVEKPFVMSSDSESRFAGNVHFADHWVLEASDRDDRATP